uniref:Calcium-binding protein 2 n=2 Tax=Schistocephalus solidus TaxID=70667 RepID=A0A0X3PV44_SCHSO
MLLQSTHMCSCGRKKDDVFKHNIGVYFLFLPQSAKKFYFEHRNCISSSTLSSPSPSLSCWLMNSRTSASLIPDPWSAVRNSFVLTVPDLSASRLASRAWTSLRLGILCCKFWSVRSRPLHLYFISYSVALALSASSANWSGNIKAVPLCSHCYILDAIVNTVARSKAFARPVMDDMFIRN